MTQAGVPSCATPSDTSEIRCFVLGVHISAFPPMSGTPVTARRCHVEGSDSSSSPHGWDSTRYSWARVVRSRLPTLSPYDGTAFARNTWALDVSALAGEEFARLLQPDVVDRLALGHSGAARVQPERVDRILRQALDGVSGTPRGTASARA